MGAFCSGLLLMAERKTPKKFCYNIHSYYMLLIHAFIDLIDYLVGSIIPYLTKSLLSAKFNVTCCEVAQSRNHGGAEAP